LLACAVPQLLELGRVGWDLVVQARVRRRCLVQASRKVGALALGVGPDARQLSSSVLTCLRGLGPGALGPGVSCGDLVLFAVCALHAS
jgi:hypothetical protein